MGKIQMKKNIIIMFVMIIIGFSTLFLVGIESIKIFKELNLEKMLLFPTGVNEIIIGIIGIVYFYKLKDKFFLMLGTGFYIYGVEHLILDIYKIGIFEQIFKKSFELDNCFNEIIDFSLIILVFFIILGLINEKKIEIKKVTVKIFKYIIISTLSLIIFNEIVIGEKVYFLSKLFKFNEIILIFLMIFTCVYILKKYWKNFNYIIGSLFLFLFLELCLKIGIKVFQILNSNVLYFAGYIISILDSIIILIGFSIQGILERIKEKEELKEIKKLEYKLKEKEKFYKKILENSNDGIIIINENKIKYANKKIAEMLDYKREELLYTGIEKYIIEEKKEAMNKRVVNRMSGKKEIEIYDLVLVKKTGEKILVEINAKKIEYENGFADLVFIRDLSEKQMLIKTLIEKNSQLKAIFENINAMVYLKDKKLRYVIANDEFLKIYKKPIQEIIGKRDSDILPKEIANEYEQEDKLVMENDMGMYNLEKKAYDEEGRLEWVSVSKTPFYDEKGKVIGMLGTIFDITDQKKMRLSLKEAKQKADKANKEKSAFLAAMSHELRTPMNAILGITDTFLKNNLEKYDLETVKGIKMINSSGKRLLDIVNNILDISKLNVNKMEKKDEIISLDEILENQKIMSKSLLKDDPIKFELVKMDEVPNNIIADGKKLEQILVNLIGNAIKFTNSGIIKLKVYLKKEKIFFEIEDTGIGIKKENVNYLFEEFSQIEDSNIEKYNGTGLGLNLSKKLVELLEGKIEVESEFKKGTKFTFNIPLKVPVEKEKKFNKEILKGLDAKDVLEIINILWEEMPKLEKELEESIKRGKKKYIKQSLHSIKGVLLNLGGEVIGKKIQVLENSLEEYSLNEIEKEYKRVKEEIKKFKIEIGKIEKEYTTKQKKAVLKEEKLENNITKKKILVVEDMETNRYTIKLMLKNKNYDLEFAENGKIAIEKYLENKPDIIFMDMQMPIMDGREAFEKIKKIDPKIVPVIAMTGEVMEEEIKRIKDIGFDGYISKPIMEKKLMNILKEQI